MAKPVGRQYIDPWELEAKVLRLERMIHASLCEAGHVKCDCSDEALGIPRVEHSARKARNYPCGTCAQMPIEAACSNCVAALDERRRIIKTSKRRRTS